VNVDRPVDRVLAALNEDAIAVRSMRRLFERKGAPEFA
jgi:hypothetical protein